MHLFVWAQRVTEGCLNIKFKHRGLPATWSDSPTGIDQLTADWPFCRSDKVSNHRSWISSMLPGVLMNTFTLEHGVCYCNQHRNLVTKLHCDQACCSWEGHCKAHHQRLKEDSVFWTLSVQMTARKHSPTARLPSRPYKHFNKHQSPFSGLSNPIICVSFGLSPVNEDLASWVS